MRHDAYYCLTRMIHGIVSRKDGNVNGCTLVMPKERKIEPVVKNLDEEDGREALEYWLSKTPEERFGAALCLREQYFVSLDLTSPPAVERVAAIISS